MNPELAAKSITHLASIPLPFFMWGSPGTGKSSIARQSADRLFSGGKVTKPIAVKNAKQKTVAHVQKHFVDLRLSLLDAVDLRGIPVERDGTTYWVPPAFLPTNDSIKAGTFAPQGMIFLDEFVQAMPIVMSAASQLILDRRIGDYELPEGWVIGAAGNREGDRAATNKMPSHIANRFVHIDVEVDNACWLRWAATNGIHPMVQAFIRFRPNLLYVFDAKAKAYPTLRSWEYVSRIMYAAPPAEALLEIIRGTVGEAAAIQFVGFVRVYDTLVDYDDVIAKPRTTSIPDNAATMYAVAQMLAMSGTAGDAAPIFQYIARMPEEFQVVCVRTIEAQKSEMVQSLPYIQWMSDHQKLMANAA